MSTNFDPENNRFEFEHTTENPSVDPQKTESSVDPQKAESYSAPAAQNHQQTADARQDTANHQQASSPMNHTSNTYYRPEEVYRKSADSWETAESARTKAKPKAKKKNSLGKKIVAAAAIAAVFGSVSGAAFFGVKTVAENVFGTAVESTQEAGAVIGSTNDARHSADADQNGAAKDGTAGADVQEAAGADTQGAADTQDTAKDTQDAAADTQDAADEDTAGSSEIQDTLDGIADANENGVIGSTSEANKTNSLTHAAAADTADLSVAEIAKNTMPAMVAITNTSVETVRNFFSGGLQDYESVSKGTGVIVGQNDTEILIATNAHVVNNANSLSVTFVDDSTVEGAVKGSDVKNDLAIVAVKIEDISAETISQIKFVEIGDSDKIEVGEQVVAIGNALGYGQSVSSGYLSAKDRGVETETGETAGLLQTDAAINPGNSGGALLNMKGQLIGINSAKYADTSVEGMGFAIPINTAAPILEKMMNRVTREKVDAEHAAYFGIKCYSVSSEAAQYYHIPEGVYVQDITPGSAADKAGMKQGDIITAIDGDTVTSDEDLTNLLSYYAAGDEAKITVARAGEGGQYSETDLTITFDSRPEQ